MFISKELDENFKKFRQKVLEEVCENLNIPKELVQNCEFYSPRQVEMTSHFNNLKKLRTLNLLY